MRCVNRLLTTLLVVTTSITLVTFSAGIAHSRNDSAPGQLKKLSKGRSAVKGNLKTTQHIYYAGETIVVSIKFSRGWELLADLSADAHVVVIYPDSTVIPFPVDKNVGPTDRKFFDVPLVTDETLPVGQYQVALILTSPGGDPTNLQDWYNGFRGLLDMEGVYISSEPLPEDADRDGECDFDDDSDGFCDDSNQSDDDDETRYRVTYDEDNDNLS